MEASAGQTQSTPRSRPPPSHRADSLSSRSSTLTANSRMTPHSNNGSSSDLAVSSPQQKSTHLSHRYHPARMSTSNSIDGPRLSLTKERCDGSQRSESRQSNGFASTYLQEKLQLERKLDSQRSVSRMADHMSTSLELRPVQSSPARRPSNNDTRRPRSSGGGGAGDPVKKKGLGLKEMENAMTTLHKQNFDLKLELFHRREKQTAMEGQVIRLGGRVDTLEEEKQELEDINDKLLGELEKRDKAVEEAVAVIVSLEARLEVLMSEREMVQKVESDGFMYASGGTIEPPTGRSTSRMDSRGLAPHDGRGVSRMPSFLSERSENTENLRNVYLGALGGSLLSLPRMSEDFYQGHSHRQSNDLADADMSVLSESSFLSVYGAKHSAHNSPPQTSPPSELRANKYQFDTKTPTPARFAAGSQTKTPVKERRSGSLSRANAPDVFTSLAGLVDLKVSPLQRLENMERSMATMNDASRPGSQDDQGIASLAAKSASRARQEKRDALKRVRTDGGLGRELGGHQLPPTPDTISTSTLRRFKNSNDTLAQDRAAENERTFLALSETTATSSRAPSLEKPSDRAMLVAADARPGTQPASVTAFDGRRTQRGSSYFDNRLPIPDRPRSADETTISYGRAREANGWDSDSSDDINGDDSASLHDYWLRESLRANGRVATGRPKVGAPGQGGTSTQAGRASPDLFSFPSNKAGWSTGAMFGSLGGNGFLGAAGAPQSGAMDALGDSLLTPHGDTFGTALASPGPNGSVQGPPPPNRRSSLHARTGSTSASSSRQTPANGKLRKSPTRSSAISRSNSIDSKTQSRPTSSAKITFAPVQQDLAPQKQRHYPPLSNTPGPSTTNPPRGRKLSWFRRSGSHEQTPSSAPPSAFVFPPAAKATQAAQVGVPSWVKRGDLADDDRDSATPPPILRNPRASVNVTDAPGDHTVDPPLPTSPLKEMASPEVVATEQVTQNGTPNGGRRGFFGIGGIGRVRNRAG